MVKPLNVERAQKLAAERVRKSQRVEKSPELAREPQGKPEGESPTVLHSQ